MAQSKHLLLGQQLCYSSCFIAEETEVKFMVNDMARI